MISTECYLDKFLEFDVEEVWKVLMDWLSPPVPESVRKSPTVPFFKGDLGGTLTGKATSQTFFQDKVITIFAMTY